MLSVFTYHKKGASARERAGVTPRGGINWEAVQYLGEGGHNIFLGGGHII